MQCRAFPPVPRLLHPAEAACLRGAVEEFTCSACHAVRIWPTLPSLHRLPS